MYQVIARKFRPRTFKEMFGQEPLVTTLKNAIRLNRLPYAYLFSGPKGTGKTSIARVLAKALNCQKRTDEDEPCNSCSSCIEIQNGTSLDVLEIDGASNRGIDDIRKINETVSFSALSGRYKIYLIDEVHMLTKEAFNALLKTLEEPPEKVKFLFATTEPHKILPTILSRCQRFQLKRISPELILKKLRLIAKNLNIEIEDGALNLIAKKSDGGLRDAESLFDQIINFKEGTITSALVEEMLGAPSKETLFDLDQALKNEDQPKLQSIGEKIYQSGLDIAFFYESLIDHFRTLLLVKFQAASPLMLSDSDLASYQENQTLYTKNGLIAIIDALLDAQQKARSHPLNLMALEQLLYKLCRLTHLESVGTLVKKLNELEKRMGGAPLSPDSPVSKPNSKNPAVQKSVIEKPSVKNEIAPNNTPPRPIPTAEITLDPTPSAEDLKGIKPAIKKEPPIKREPPKTLPVSAPPLSNVSLNTPLSAKAETLLQFAAIELEGKINKN